MRDSILISLLALTFSAPMSYASVEKISEKCRAALAGGVQIFEYRPTSAKKIEEARAELANTEVQLQLKKKDVGPLRAQLKKFKKELSRRRSHNTRGAIMFRHFLESLGFGETIADGDLESEIAELEELIESGTAGVRDMEKTVADIKAEIAEFEASSVEEYRSSVNSFVNGHAEYAAKFRDIMNAHWISSHESKTRAALMFSAEDHGKIGAEVDLALHFLEKGYVVLLDGQAASTPKILRQAKESDQVYVLVETESAEFDPSRQLVIADKYLRWTAFIESGVTVGSKGSQFALASAIYDQLTDIVGDGFNVDELKKWGPEIRKARGLGIPEFKGIEVAFSYNSPTYRYKKNVESKWFKAPVLESWNYGGMEAIVSETNTAVKYAGPASVAEAVIFGGATFDKASAPLVYSVSYVLAQNGIGVVTGGAGGAMWTANKGAYDGGGISIGIPMVGAGKLVTEKEARTEIQTDTLPVQSYETRVPLLIDGKQLYIVAPGGGGTLREVGAALLDLSSRADDEPGAMIFLEESYYGPFVRWLLKQDLPESMKKRIWVASSQDEFVDILNELGEAGVLKLSTTQTPPKPRGEYLPPTEFPFKDSIEIF